MKFVKISSIIIGLLIINQWLFFLLTGNVPEIQTAPIEITFHIIIELVTAAVLIASAMLFTADPKNRPFVSSARECWVIRTARDISPRRDSGRF